MNRPADVTRSTVQKAVVVIADSPQFFGQLREKLSMVTGAWFAQKYERNVRTEWEIADVCGGRDFTDVDLLKVGEWDGVPR